MRQVCAHEGIKIFLNGFFFLKHWASVIIFINHSLVWGNWLYGKKATIVLCWSCDEYDQKQLRIPLMSCSKFPFFLSYILTFKGSLCRKNIKKVRGFLSSFWTKNKTLKGGNYQSTKVLKMYYIKNSNKISLTTTDSNSQLSIHER